MEVCLPNEAIILRSILHGTCACFSFICCVYAGPGYDSKDSALNFHTIHAPNLNAAWALLNIAKDRSVNWGSNQVAICFCNCCLVLIFLMCVLFLFPVPPSKPFAFIY
jgi:hypothetical protein